MIFDAVYPALRIFVIFNLSETLLTEASEADLLCALVHNSLKVARSVVYNIWVAHVTQLTKLLDSGYSEFGLVPFPKVC